MSEPNAVKEVLPTVEQLQLVNAELQRRKTDAENDRDLFRELYSKASAHASEVTRENNELQERLALVEGQLRDGLAMVRGTYEERVRRLTEEADRWRSLCGVLTARDERTDDEVRRRAALEPELREENGRLRAELDRLSEDYRRMEDTLAQLAEQEQADGVPPGPDVPKVEMVNATTSRVASVQVAR